MFYNLSQAFIDSLNYLTPLDFVNHGWKINCPQEHEERSDVKTSKWDERLHPMHWYLGHDTKTLMLENWLNRKVAPHHIYPILCNKNSYEYRLQDQPQSKLCKCSLQLDWRLRRNLLFEFQTNYESLFSTTWITRPTSWPPGMNASKRPTKKLGLIFSNVVQNWIVQWHNVFLACRRGWFEGCY